MFLARRLRELGKTEDLDSIANAVVNDMHRRTYYPAHKNLLPERILPVIERATTRRIYFKKPIEKIAPKIGKLRIESSTAKSLQKRVESKWIRCPRTGRLCQEISLK